MTTSFEGIIKNIILLSGKKECRDLTKKQFLQVLEGDVEALQFGFFLKTYASKITELDEIYIRENSEGLLNFKSEGVLHRINDCVNDTANRLNIAPIQYNKMALLSIINQFLNTSYRLEHELPEIITINTRQLTRQIGEIWKLIFTPSIWTDLVLTAVNRSPYKNIIVNDFRFPEECYSLYDKGAHEIYAIKIMDSASPLVKEEGYHISEYALEDFKFDYLVNCTIPQREIHTNYIQPQIEAILEIIETLQIQPELVYTK